MTTNQRVATADLALYKGAIPGWLSKRMEKLALAITEPILMESGTSGFIQRLSDPYWFQCFGAVLGMDWNSSGVTTAVMAALKRAIQPHSQSLGLYVCGGKGNSSRQTPKELLAIGDKTGLDARYLIHCSKLSAKVDNTAIQDGFQLYLHNFIVNAQGEWAVVQQGMRTGTATARRYHWYSGSVSSFTQEPHTAICGIPKGIILNMTDKQALPAQTSLLEIAKQPVLSVLQEVKHMKLPQYCDIKVSDVNLKRLGALLAVAQEHSLQNFEEFLLLEGLGPRTLQSLALVSEVIYGTPTHFNDPARYSFAHGGKGGRPFGVPLKVYDQTISTLKTAVEKAKIGETDKQQALKKLVSLVDKAESSFVLNDNPEKGFEAIIQEEKENAQKYGSRSVQRKTHHPAYQQLKLFEQY